MLPEIFLKIVNMSITASWLVLAVIVLRLLLRKAPRGLLCLLWLLVAIRLLCPFSIQSSLSLLPSTETIPPALLYEQPPLTHQEATLDIAVNPALPTPYTPAVEASVDRMQTLTVFGLLLWLAGIAAMLAYALISYLRLRRRVLTAIRLRDNIWQSEAVASPFVLGFFRPRIYLPFALSPEEAAHIISHEQAHIARHDQLWKPLAFLLLSVHWFNPLIWLAYILLGRDLELACDEKVIRALSREQRAAYSAALLRCSAKQNRSVEQREIALCPLTFSGVGVRERVKHMMNYKKPALWIAVMAIAVMLATAACLMTDPQTETVPPAEQQAEGGIPQAVQDRAEAHVQAQMLLGSIDGTAVWQDWRITELALARPYQLGRRMFDLYSLNYQRQAIDLERVAPMVLDGAIITDDNWVSNNVTYYLLYDAQQGRIFGQPLAVPAGLDSKRFQSDLNLFLPYWLAQEAVQDMLLAEQDQATLDAISNFNEPRVVRQYPPSGGAGLDGVRYLSQTYNAAKPIYAVTFAMNAEYGADSITLYVDADGLVFATDLG